MGFDRYISILSFPWLIKCLRFNRLRCVKCPINVGIGTHTT
jgi:hypothetical protein